VQLHPNQTSTLGSSQCKVCKELSEDLVDWEGISHTFADLGLSTLKESAASCWICSLVHQGVITLIPECNEAQHQVEGNATVRIYARKEVGTLEVQVVIRDCASLREADILRPDHNRGDLIVNTFLEFYTPEGRFSFRQILSHIQPDLQYRTIRS